MFIACGIEPLKRTSNLGLSRAGDVDAVDPSVDRIDRIIMDDIIDDDPKPAPRQRHPAMRRSGDTP